MNKTDWLKTVCLVLWRTIVVICLAISFNAAFSIGDTNGIIAGIILMIILGINTLWLLLMVLAALVRGENALKNIRKETHEMINNEFGFEEDYSDKGS